MGILNGIRGDVRWMLKIGGFVLVVSGAVLTITFPLLKDFVASMPDIRHDIRMHDARLVTLERNDEKLFAVKEKRDAQIQELLRKMETGH